MSTQNHLQASVSTPSNYLHIPRHIIMWQEHLPGVSQDWPIGLYAVATPAITATDTIIEVSEMNFMFVMRRVLRLDDLSSVELSGKLRSPLTFYTIALACPRQRYIPPSHIRRGTGYLARHSHQSPNTPPAHGRNVRQPRCIRG